MNKVVLLFVLVAMLCSCKKYEEGPQVSFRSAKKRVDGTWLIHSYRVDGADSMNAVKALKLDNIFVFSELKITQGSIFIKDSNFQDLYIGKWKFDDNKNTQLSISISHKDLSTIPLRDVWTILRLKNDEMWLRLEKDGKRYELRFKDYTT